MRKFVFFSLIVLFTGILPAGAQQCAVADGISYPVDTNIFRLAQDFEAASPRHQGRYHTGEDWYAGRVDHYGVGLPVVAAANGRVTFSSPIGWGRDGGVVIIEHTFADGSVLFTHYGHMMETETARFPAPLACVQAGQVIGAVGQARPAPHVHFEIRARDGTSPGPGYSWNMPTTEGWLRPAKMIDNRAAWQHPAFRWRLDLIDETGPAAPPLELDDHSLLYIDTNRLGRVTPDGRSLWRINLERPAVSITDLNGRPLLTYADGVMQHVNIDGTLAERWEIGVLFSQPLVIHPELLVFQSPNGTLTALGPDRRQVLWQLGDIPPVVRSQLASQVMGLVTESSELLTVSLNGQLLDSTPLNTGGSMDTDPNGVLHAYTNDGLWSILPDGAWQINTDQTPAGNRSASALHTASGEIYLFDGAVLSAYDANFTLRWQVSLPENVGGLTRMSDYGDVLLLTSNHGNILAIQKESGGVCGLTKIYGIDVADFWHRLGADGILRVAVSDQILGLDWGAFLGGCRG